MSLEAYKLRNEILAELGYSSYDEYLRSELWARIRSWVFYTKGSNCFICNNRAELIHHQEYSKNVLLGYNRHPLIPICRKCHGEVEFGEDGTKLELNEVAKIVKSRLIRKSYWQRSKKNRKNHH